MKRAEGKARGHSGPSSPKMAQPAGLSKSIPVPKNVLEKSFFLEEDRQKFPIYHQESLTE